MADHCTAARPTIFEHLDAASAAEAGSVLGRYQLLRAIHNAHQVIPSSFRVSSHEFRTMRMTSLADIGDPSPVILINKEATYRTLTGNAYMCYIIIACNHTLQPKMLQQTAYCEEGKEIGK